MFDVTPDPIASDSALVDPTIAVCERHLRLLEEVGDIAMEVTRAFGASAKTAARKVEEVLGDEVWQPETGMQRALSGSKDAADVFQKVTRALRLTFALEKATAETLRDLRAGILPERKPAPPASRPENPSTETTAAATPRDAFRTSSATS